MLLDRTTRRRVVAALAAVRVGVGVTALLAPAAMRLVGVDAARLSPQGRFFARGFAVREVVVGATLLGQLRRGSAITEQLMLNAVCDGGDLVALLAMGRRGGRLQAVGVPLSAAVTGAWIALAAPGRKRALG